LAPAAASSRRSALLLRLRAPSGPSAARGGAGTDAVEDDEADEDEAPAASEGEAGGQVAVARLEK
jgi:hypothetical protein